MKQLSSSSASGAVTHFEIIASLSEHQIPHFIRNDIALSFRVQREICCCSSNWITIGSGRDRPSPDITGDSPVP
jgi:hypothetical protein